MCVCVGGGGGGGGGGVAGHGEAARLDFTFSKLSSQRDN